MTGMFNRFQIDAWQSLLACVVAGFSWPSLGNEEVQFEVRNTQTSVSFRGIVVSGDGTVWVGGSDATLLKSHDSGKTWISLQPGVPRSCDFRDVEATISGRIVVMSAGKGPNSRVVVTRDNGRTWRTVLENPDAEGFFNGMAFTKSGFGALVGDPVGGRLTVFVSSDGGLTWKKTQGPKVIRDEYGFAASGTGIVVDADHKIGIVTGGSRCRYYTRSPDSGAWSEYDLGMQHGTNSASAFSVAFAGANGVVVGGDHLKPTLADGNVAVTRDGGRTWMVPKIAMPHKACVVAIGGDRFLTCGRTGIALTNNGGESWRELSSESFYTMTLAPSTSQDADPVAWLAGADGRVAFMRFKFGLRE